MSVFDAEDYREYFRDRIRAMPSRGKGQLKKLAGKLRVHPSLLSQIFGGDRDFTDEQALGVAEAFGLNEQESEYLVELVRLSRASREARGNPQNDRLRALQKRRVERLREEALNPDAASARANGETTAFTEADRAVFYSNWYYSAIRLRSAIAPAPSLDVLSADLGLPLKLVRQVTDFLVKHGLCVEKNGKFKIGPNRTWIDAASPLVVRHHHNWRMKGMEQMPKKGPGEVFLTVPMAIAEKDIPKVAEIIQEMEKKLYDILDATPSSEKLVCINVDWFRF